MRRHPWLVVSVLAVLGVLVLGAFPVRAYVAQNNQRRELGTSVQSLATENQRLVDLATRLQSDDTIERLARDRYQLVRPGEEAYAILPEAQLPAAVPPGASTGPPPVHQNWLSRVWSRLTSIV